MKKKSGIWGKIVITFCVIIAIFAGGYFALDKLIVPKYFGKYGISNVPDLVGVVTSLYKNPKESKLVTNGYTAADLSNSINKLQVAGYKINDEGIVNKEDFDSFKGNGRLELSDREFAAICNKMLENGMLVDALPNLKYLNTMKIKLLQITVTPDMESAGGEGFSAGNITSIIKIETEDIREQIAIQMQTPSYLLNMIIPDNLYFTVSYDFDLKNEADRLNGTIAINGRTAKQSELLINLLISFIFPEEDNMNIEKFNNAVGDIVLKGIDELGQFEFIANVDDSQQHGFLINAN